jgi:hypothetical protein
LRTLALGLSVLVASAPAGGGRHGGDRRWRKWLHLEPGLDRRQDARERPCDLAARAYYLDVGGIKWLAEDGSTGPALTTVSAQVNTAVGFAVSPDGARAAISITDYSRQPATIHLQVATLTSGRTTEIYTATDWSAAPTAALWPAGWRGGNIVLGYHRSTCTQLGAPALSDAQSYHLADPVTADRVATIGSDSGAGCGLLGIPEPRGIP